VYTLVKIRFVNPCIEMIYPKVIKKQTFYPLNYGAEACKIKP